MNPLLKNIDAAYYINLDRRTDRRHHMESNLPFPASRFSALDSSALELGNKLKQSFPTSYLSLTKPEMACSLSHYSLWKQLVMDKAASNYLILEDDAVFLDGFVDRWNNEFSRFIPDDYYLIYLGGCQPWNKPQYPKVLDPYNQYFNRIKKNDYFTTGTHYWHMNAQSYILSKEAASLLCQWVDSAGFDLKKGQAQDVFMINFFNENKLFESPHQIYHLNPLMTYQLHEENDNPEIDKNSDLRHSSDYFAPTSQDEKPPLIWQIPSTTSYEVQWVREVFSGCYSSEIWDGNMEKLQDNSIIIYSDCYHPQNIPPNHTVRLQQDAYLKKASLLDKCYLIHLSDEFSLASLDHYSSFRHVFRNYFRQDASAIPNVTFFPLGYSSGFVPSEEGSTTPKRSDPILKNLLTPVSIPFPKRHYGCPEDGGYICCSTSFNAIKTVYSYGVGDSPQGVDFDVACADSGKSVFMYDGTVDGPPLENALFHFAKENLTRDNFPLHLASNNHLPETNMLLKMDIEGYEYDVLLGNIDLVSRHFSLLNIEFHGINNSPQRCPYYPSKDKREVFAKLLEHYHIYHIHGNNWVERRYEVPNVLEISFIRKGDFKVSPERSSYPIDALDFPNCPGREDYTLNWWRTRGGSPFLDFPFLRKVSLNIIPKKIHLSWRNKNILDSDSPLVLNGVRRLASLNPDWDIEISDDEDVERYLRDSIGADDYSLIKDKKIVEKSDLWRLLKIYKEGGLYIDIDRYCNIPLSELLDPLTRVILPRYFDVDFSQDFVMSAPENFLYEKAIYSNLYGRREGKSLFYLAVESYMRSLTEVIGGKPVGRQPGDTYWNDIVPKLEACPYISTYMEKGPFDTILFKYDPSDFIFSSTPCGSDADSLAAEYTKQKALFYSSEGVTHWNSDTQSAFDEYL